ncbi:MAG TPA: hypothetical protein PKN86_19500, partial [Candidatus Obscuribacter sp.]|nr:hypothetical protein [Candidatus Obscuribacter sp.]
SIRSFTAGKISSGIASSPAQTIIAAPQLSPKNPHENQVISVPKNKLTGHKRGHTHVQTQKRECSKA